MSNSSKRSNNALIFWNLSLFSDTKTPNEPKNSQIINTTLNMPNKPNDEKNAAQKNIGISTKMLFSRCSPLKNKFAALFINTALIRI